MVGSPKSPEGCTSVGEVIANPGNTLATLVHHANTLARLESLLSGSCSPDLATQFQVADLRRDRLVLLAPTASWATRLRMEAGQMLQFLHASGYEHLRHIDIRVAPLSRPVIPTPVRKPHSAAAELALGLMAQLTRKNRGDP
jgi:hypothetical protein